MTKKDMQNNMRAMLAKTKVSSDTKTTSGSMGGTQTVPGYQPRKNFTGAPKPPPKPVKKKVEVRSSQNGRQVIVQSQKSIYKPTLVRADSTAVINKRKNSQKPSEKPPTTFKSPVNPLYKKPSISPIPKLVEKKKEEAEQEPCEEIESQYFDDEEKIVDEKKILDKGDKIGKEMDEAKSIVD